MTATPPKDRIPLGRPGSAVRRGRGSGGLGEGLRRLLTVWAGSLLLHLLVLGVCAAVVMFVERRELAVATKQDALEQAIEIVDRSDAVEALDRAEPVVEPEVAVEEPVEDYLEAVEYEIALDEEPLEREREDVVHSSVELLMGAESGSQAAFMRRGRRAAEAGAGGAAQGAEHDGTRPRGEISIVLQWEFTDSNAPGGPDIDIVVLDPRRRVLSSSREGFALGPTPEGGRIDFDDRGRWFHDGGGPERVFWPAGRAPEGEYRIWVRYYAGSGRADYTVTVYEGEREVMSERGTLRRERELQEIGRHEFRRNREPTPASLGRQD